MFWDITHPIKRENQELGFNKMFQLTSPRWTNIPTNREETHN